MAVGVTLSVVSSVLFGTLYYLATALEPLTGTEIFGWRMPLTLPFVTIFMLGTGEWRHVRDICYRMIRKPALFVGLVTSSALLGIQQWLFLWAPINGAAMSVSIGYFLLPLTLLLVGRIIYRDRLSIPQWVAAFCAFVGVLHAVYGASGLSWETALVALGFPAYFAFRRLIRIDNLGGLWFDMALMSPVALWFVASQGGVVAPLSAAPHLYALLPLLALLSAGGFICYILASRILPLPLFGLLGYVEPVLLFAVSLAIGEAINQSDAITYVPIATCVAILAIEGFCRARISAAGPCKQCA